MALDINALRAAFTAPTQSAPSNYFPFFLMKDGEQSTIRILPDANRDNPLGFMVPKHTHVLKVNGKDKVIPCLKMYGKDCPICKVAAAYYNAGDRTNGKRYYRKVAHVAQALVLRTTVPAREGEDGYEGTVRLVQLSPQIHKVIQEAIMSGDLENDPSDYELGTDFVIKKDKQGEYSTYSFSKFAKRESPLPEEVVDYVKTQLKDLSSLLPTEPPLEEVEAWLEAEMTGGEAPVTQSNRGAAPRVDTQRRPAVEDDGEGEDDAMAALAALKARREQAAPKPQPPADDEGDAEMDDVLAALAARRRQREV